MMIISGWLVGLRDDVGKGGQQEDNHVLLAGMRVAGGLGGQHNNNSGWLV